MLSVPGRIVLEALNHGVSNLPSAAGYFPQVSGLTMTVDASAPAGNRVLRTEGPYFRDNSRLDLNDNALIVDYTDTRRAAPLARRCKAATPPAPGMAPARVHIGVFLFSGV